MLYILSLVAYNEGVSVDYITNYISVGHELDKNRTYGDVRKTYDEIHRVLNDVCSIHPEDGERKAIADIYHAFDVVCGGAKEALGELLYELETTFKVNPHKVIQVFEERKCQPIDVIISLWVLRHTI